MLKNKIGQSIIELLIAIAISAVLLPALLSGLVTSREGKAQQKQRLIAAAYLKEAEEAIRNIRESGWTVFAVNGTYHPEISGNNWTLTPGAETIDDFTRNIIISDVYRDANGYIVETGGSLDPSTKKAVITISWNTPIPSSIIESTIYLVRRLNNVSYIETTEADFQAGTSNEVTITNNEDGEIILSLGEGGDWCNPNLSITALDLPKQGEAKAITAIEGHAFVGTGDNSSGVSFANIALTDTNPPIATIEGTYDNCCKTNDVFGETNYAYLATDTNAKDIVIIDISNIPYTEVGYFDAPGSKDAKSVFVSNNIGYMIKEKYVYNFDLSSKIGSRPSIDEDGVRLSGNATEIKIVGNYAYISIHGGSIEMEIVDISDPTNLIIVGQADPGGGPSEDVFVDSTGTRAYLIVSNQLHIIDVSTKIGNQPTIGSYDTGEMEAKGVVAVTNNKVIVVGEHGDEYQVVDIADEASPTNCGSFNLDDTEINGIATVLEADGDTYSYIITEDANSEFQIIQGGPGTEYSDSGDFESSTFDPGLQVAFNRLNVNYSQPPQTEIKFQIAIADPVGGSCDAVTFDYVGPDGTPSSFFTNSDTIPLNDDGNGFENPGQCLRYKAYFSTADKLASPVLYDININYSP